MCSADHPALIDEITTDIYRITCRNLSKLQNDATVYFDRMVTNLTTLCYRLYNVPDLACRLQSSALNKMKYCIITKIGTSKRSYSNTKTKRIHGSYQNLGALGSNWLFTSVPMMDTIEYTCDGFIIYSSDGIIKWVKYIIGLVDDARQYTNNWTDNDINQILYNLHDSSQTWEHLLNTTGGKSEIPKCAIYTLKWDFDKQAINFLKENTQSSITIQSSETKLN